MFPVCITGSGGWAGYVSGYNPLTLPSQVQTCDGRVGGFWHHDIIIGEFSPGTYTLWCCSNKQEEPLHGARIARIITPQKYEHLRHVRSTGILRNICILPFAILAL
uniref:Uncharacterized protein n=1 Tax=Pyxicephalus adspersus TaxID=30357 RepID=A0AAV3AL70_PYXAD|nr:TPA: hypothetical protein GDO54_011428 [Pyxicephalus adspersus]